MSNHTTYDVYPGIMANEAIALFQSFYTSENKRAPEVKRRHKRTLEELKR
jgi:hypothetical protein